MGYTNGGIIIKLNKWGFFIAYNNIGIEEGGKKVAYIDSKESSYGHSFIEKAGEGYILYYINRKGEAGAVDTSGKRYVKEEAMEKLKEIDEEKYGESYQRAKDLGIEGEFLRGEGLVWGETYYTSPEKINDYWGRIVYPSSDNQIQYDIQGNGYQAIFRYGDSNKSSIIWIVSPDGRHLEQIDIGVESDILSTYRIADEQYYTKAIYVGYGGNIYYYVTGTEYTEVFRIRRTWGRADKYALAVNGYTEDEYGAYVKKVISEMSREELRVLRNTIYALYGYEFKDEGLREYFEKQVWYEGKGEVRSEGLELPDERQRLLELIQEEEGKR